MVQRIRYVLPGFPSYDAIYRVVSYSEFLCDICGPCVFQKHLSYLSDIVCCELRVAVLLALGYLLANAVVYAPLAMRLVFEDYTFRCLFPHS
jgi:hypothetical protein